MQKWEYAYVQMIGANGYVVNGVSTGKDPNEKMPDVLNRMGADGWELIYCADPDFSTSARFLFKRPVTVQESKAPATARERA